MNTFGLISFYTPGNTILHRLNILCKILVFSFYVIAIFYLNDIANTLLLFLILIGFGIILRLPLRNRAAFGLVLVLLTVVILTKSYETVVGRFVIAFGKIMCLSVIVSLFTMTTKLNSVFQYMTQNVSNRSALVFADIYYVCSTSIAVVPSIQFDLQKAIDSETIRLGKKVGIFSVGSWVSILVMTLVRTLSRTERFTDTVMDRGFNPYEGIQMLSESSFHFWDLFIAACLIVPGLLLWFVPL